MVTINLHTHHALPENQQGILSHSIVEPFKPIDKQSYSVGLHPWDIFKVENNWLAHLKEALSNEKVIAIGECGIDHAIDIPIDVQTELFEDQIKLAETHQLPLIIHAVRSYAELLYLRKKHQAKQAWILHAYNGNLQTTQMLLKYDFYFSIGEGLLKFKKDWLSIIRIIPLNKLFVETDASALDINMLYERIAQLYGIEKSQLEEQVFQNYNNLFLQS